MVKRAGWYEDPDDQTQLRYWDGRRWQQMVKPAPDVPDWYEDPEHQTQLRYWDGHQWTDQVRKTHSVPFPTDQTSGWGAHVRHPVQTDSMRRTSPEPEDLTEEQEEYARRFEPSPDEE